MEYILVLLGILLGSIISNIIFYNRSGTGYFRIDSSNPDKDTYRLEIDDLDALNKKNRLILKIDHDAHLSQE